MKRFLKYFQMITLKLTFEEQTKYEINESAQCDKIKGEREVKNKLKFNFVLSFHFFTKHKTTRGRQRKRDFRVHFFRQKKLNKMRKGNEQNRKHVESF